MIKQLTKKLSLILVVFLIASLVTSILPQKAHAAWYDTLWNYRKSLTVNHTDDGAQALYQMKRILLFAGTTCNSTHLSLDSKCQADFDDIRFTKSDNVTLIPYWIESKTDSVSATVWIQVDTIPASPNDGLISIYYGNAAATAVSNGADTFIVFDDFERGNDGDPVGGSWTVVGGSPQIDTALKYGGTRSLYMPATAICTLPVAVSDTIAIRMHYYKTDAGQMQIMQGNGTYIVSGYTDGTEDVKIYDGASYVDTTKNLQVITWGTYEYNTFNWAAATVKVVVDGSASAAMDASYNAASYNNQLGVRCDANSFNLDNVIVYKWTLNEPTWGNCGSEETKPVAAPTVVTLTPTNVEETTLTLNANVTVDCGANANVRGFTWSTTSNTTSPAATQYPPAGYTSNWSENGNFPVGTFSSTGNITGLSAGTCYYYRAYAHCLSSANYTDGWGWSSQNSTLTKPNEPNTLACTSGDQQCALTWNKGTGATYTYIRYKVGSYPTDITDGTFSYNGTASGNTQGGLTNGLNYYFRLWSWVSGCTTPAQLTQFSDLTADTICTPVVPPTTPFTTTLAATNIEETTVTLSGNVTSGVNITMRAIAYGTTSNGTTPASIQPPPATYTTNWTESGSFSTEIYSSTGNITGLTSATCYYFRATSYNATGWGWSTVELSFLTKPLNPTAFTCAAGNGQVILSWTNAIGGAGTTVNTVIRYSTVAYPNSVTGVDGSTLSYNGTGVTTTQGGLSNCITHYFSAWTQVFGCSTNQYSDNPPAQCNAMPFTVSVITNHCTGFSTDWGIVNGETALGVCTAPYTQRGFDYGVSAAYGNESLETGAWTTATSWSAVLTPLSPATFYHYRAKVLSGVTWYYGADRVFSTKGSPSKYEYYEDASTGSSGGIQSANWTYQTFTTNTTAVGHSVTSIWLYLLKVGNPGTVTASIKHTSNSTQGQSCWSYPTGDDLTSGTLDGDTFSTSYTWYKFDITEKCLSANTTYAIVVKAVNGNAANYVNWGLVITGTYAGGNAGYSTNSGSSWTNLCPADFLFQVWGNPCLYVEDAKVFTSYLETSDWLVTLLYKNIYEPYYSDGTDVASMFYIQLANASGTVLAQTKCPAWGYRPGCIYLNAGQVTSLEWGYAYRVRVYGDFGAYPYMEYALQPTDWMGEDLNRLDSWVKSMATLIENYYGTTITTYLANKGLVLNEDGGVIFDLGIPALSSVRPGIFQIVSIAPGYEQEDFTGAYQTELVWQTLLGPYLTSLFTNWGIIWSVNGSIIGSFLAFLFYAVVAIFAFPVGSAIAAISIPLGIMLIAWYTGLLPLAALGVILALAAFWLIWQVWFRNA